MKNNTLFLSLLCMMIVILTSPMSVSADGGFFISDPYRDEDLTEPEQKAVLLFDGAEEQLIIQAKASGNVPDFAWVIPVPSYPKLAEADSALFEELHRITAPREVSKVGIHLDDLLLFGLFFATTGLDGDLGGVTLHESTKVGIFDASILSAKGSNALMQWLRQNNYHIPQEAVPVLQSYIEKGWYFVALKVNELNIPVLSALNEIDSRIVSIESAREVIEAEVMASLRGEPNNVSAFSEFRYSLSEDEKESMNKGYLSLPKDKYELQVFAEDISLVELQKQYRTFFSNERAYVEEYVLGDRGWSGSCHTRRGGYCINESGFGFYIGGSFSDLNGNSDIEKYLGVTGKEDLRSEIRERILDDVLNQKPYEQSFVYRMREEGLMDVTNSYKEVDGQRLPRADESKYQDMLLASRSPEGSIRSQVSTSLLTELLYPFGLSYDQTNRPLTPVSFTFETMEPIYPLKISSINGGETEVLLYTFANSYLTGGDLQLEYAGKPSLGEQSSALEDLLSGKTSNSNLTKLRGTYKAKEMTSDVVLKPDPKQGLYRMFVFEGGLKLWLADLLISLTTFYLWGLVMAAITRKIINKFAKSRPQLGSFSKRVMFTYPAIGVVLLSAGALLEVLGVSSELLKWPIVIMYFLPPILSTIVVFIVLHFVLRFIQRIR